MKYLLLAFVVSFLGSLLLIRFFSVRAVCDTCEGVQKFHERPVPRIGGVAVFCAVLVVALFFSLIGKPFARSFLLLLLCGLPVFMAGFLEDVTKKVSPFWRLIAAFVSATLAFFLVSARVTRVDLPLVDALFSFPLFSFAFTVFAVGGVSHAFNIIDGFNGLASGVAMLVFGAYAYVAFLLHDLFLVYISLVMLFATLGFFVWNYPFGFIFLGDCGAYFLGFMIAEIGVLLTARHFQVSPWFPLLLVIYPVWETLFSAYRRKFLKHRSPDLPDASHFHSLIYRRLLRMTFGNGVGWLEKNSFTSPYLWIMELICVVPAVLFWKDTYVLIFFAVAFVVSYVWLYLKIVNFETPSFLFALARMFVKVKSVKTDDNGE